MPTKFLMTLTGPDRIGIVDEVTGLLLERGGNVETSRMVRLGGAFAVLMLVALPAGRTPDLGAGLNRLEERGYTLTFIPADPHPVPERPGWVAYRIEVRGADHEGIIHEVAHYLSGHGINIESVESESSPAPTSGVPLFAMTARVAAPPSVAGTYWETGLAEVGGRLNLDITVAPARG